MAALGKQIAADFVPWVRAQYYFEKSFPTTRSVRNFETFRLPTYLVGSWFEARVHAQIEPNCQRYASALMATNTFEIKHQ